MKVCFMNKTVDINTILKNIGRDSAYVLVEKEDGTLIVADSENELQRIRKMYLKKDEIITLYTMK